MASYSIRRPRPEWQGIGPTPFFVAFGCRERADGTLLARRRAPLSSSGGCSLGFRHDDGTRAAGSEGRTVRTATRTP